MPEVTRIASEQFIAAIPGDESVDAVVPSQLGAIIGRHGGGIAEGFVVGGGH